MSLHIELNPEQEDALRSLSDWHHKSVEEIVCEAVQKFIRESSTSDDWEERKARALQAVGRFRSGKRRVSEQHDRYLAEAFDP